MPEVGSERARIDALVDQLEAGGVAQQVRMDPRHADALGSPREHLKKPFGVKGAPRSETKTKRAPASCSRRSFRSALTSTL